MPLLNPGTVVSSPYLSDDIQIIHRVDSPTLDGRGSITETPFNSYAIVCAASTNDLDRVPEAERAKRIMSFITNDRVQPVSGGTQPDMLVWPFDGTTGPRWLVVSVQPYPNYGEGWYQVLAASMDVQDVPL